MSLKSFDYQTHPFDATYEVLKSTTLQCTDFEGGCNKYYQLEIHKDIQNRYRLYSRYGRTGRVGAEEERMPSNLSESEHEFDKIVRSKGKKGYVEVKMASTSIGSGECNKKILSQDIKTTNVVSTNLASSIKIDQAIVNIVSRLFDEAGQTCQSSLNGSLQATASNPLGTLTLSQIKEGEDILKEANKILVKDSSLVNSVDPVIITLSNQFYSAIPQNIPLRPRDEESRKEWMRKYLLNNSTILDEKNDLLDLLGDIKGMVSSFGTNDISVKLYEINCDFDIVDTATHDRIRNFVENTQSRHHHWKLRVKKVWKIASKAQKSYIDYMKPIGNITPLFHGSRAANIMGICKKGLLLKPQGVYISGKMFGEANYWADQSTKSSQYATARFGGSSSRYGNSYFMFVADVALGKSKEYYDSQSHLIKPPQGYDSVKGCKGNYLLHNEYMTYDVRQNQLQYLVEFEQ
jgi:poly [ADP-ribose] polymerase